VCNQRAVGEASINWHDSDWNARGRPPSCSGLPNSAHRALAQHGLDVDDRRAIDGFNRSNSQPVSRKLLHSYRVETQRVRSILGSGCEDAGERKPPVVPRVHVEHITTGFVKPRDDNDLVADSDPGEPPATDARISSQASGAPSDPCFGASARLLRLERIIPMGRRDVRV
jgi:hypothetical protein